MSTRLRVLSVAGLAVAAVAAAGLAAPASAYELVPGSGHGHHKIPAKVRGPKGAHTEAVAVAQGSGLLKYHGGTQGIGVTTGAPKVYLVFWGSQWGTQGVDGNGYTTFSNDPMGMAPRLQAFFKGLGTNNELWSGVMTESCEGVAYGATTCPSTVPHVGYPTGGALAGVLYDNAAAEPTTAADWQIAATAVKAASTFGNTTADSNRNAQYFVVSSTGLHPDGFNAPLNWCAWHDWNGNYSGAPSTVGPIAFTNMPYLTDVGYSCGANYVNSGTAGLSDGITMVGGHEYAETITDQLPSGGWWDAFGYENSDKCSWVGGPSVTNGANNIALSTGSYPVQSNFSNVTGTCALTAPIQRQVTSTVSFTTSQVNQTSVVGTPVSVSTGATSSPSQSVTYSATGLPAGLTINAGSGTISGTPTQAILNSTVKVTATNTEGATATSSFTWTVNNVAGNTVTVNSIAGRTNGAGRTITSFTATATDNQLNQKVSFTATGLPTGITLSSAGTFSGTPTTAGTYTVTVTGTDLSAYTGTASFTWTVSKVTVTNPGTQSTTRGTTVSKQIVASDSAAGAVLTYSATNLPKGLSINSTTGVISGKSTDSSKKNYSTSVTVKDGWGASTTVSFTWSIV